MESPAPICSHASPRVTASTYCLVGAMNVGGDFDKVRDYSRNICHHRSPKVVQSQPNVGMGSA